MGIIALSSSTFLLMFVHVLSSPIPGSLLEIGPVPFNCPPDGYVHVDVEPGDGIDLAHDLNKIPWPWDDDSVDIIVAEDLVEHLAINLIQFCEEAWRVLAPAGELFVRTPHHSGDSSWIDPTHRWHLNEQAFQYLDPDAHWGRLYPHYTDRKWRILSLGIRGPQNIHALLTPRKPPPPARLKEKA